MIRVSGSRVLRLSVRSALSVLSLLLATLHAPRTARTEGASARSPRTAEASGDGVYGRFDGDLDLGLALGAELGSAGQAAPALRATAHYFSVAGVYANGRIKTGDE